jgi:integrase
MPIYPGRRPGTHRVTIYSRRKQHEWIVQGTRRDARRFEEDRRIELRAQAMTARRGELTFAAFTRERYNPHAVLHLAASTWENVRKYQVADLEVHFGELRLSQIDAAQIEGYKTECAKLGRGHRTINHYLTVLRRMLALALKWRLLDGLPEIAMLPRPAQGRPKFWTVEECGRAYRAARLEWPPFEAMLHFMLETGCRRGETIAAEWSWIDWRAEMLRIPVTRYWHPKGKRERDVPMTPELISRLRQLGPREGAIFRKDRGNKGAPYTQWPRKLWVLVTEAADLAEWTPHITRHTFASHFLGSVPDLGVLAEVMGHTQQRVTELYGHMLPERLARARGAVRLSPEKTLAPTLAIAATSRNR